MKKILLNIALLFLLIGCGRQQEIRLSSPDSIHSRTDLFVFGPVQVNMRGVECTEEFQDSRCDLMELAFDKLYDMETRFTVNQIGGEVETINEMAGIKAVEVAEDTFYMISRSVEYSLSSDRLFNVAIGPLIKLWNIGMPGTRRPSEEEIAYALEMINPEYIDLNYDEKTVFLRYEGMRLDLGGVAKGFMADEIVRFLMENGVEHGFLRVGGELVAFGGQPDGRPFRFGIANPFFDDDSWSSNQDLVAVLPVYDQAMVTSGTYNRFFANQDTMTIYHHMFDSRTGFPFETDIISLTVIAPTGLLGEVYTKVLYGMSIEEGINFVENHAEIEVVMITLDKEIFISNGLVDSFDLLLPEHFTIITQ